MIFNKNTPGFYFFSKTAYFQELNYITHLKKIAYNGFSSFVFKGKSEKATKQTQPNSMYQKRETRQEKWYQKRETLMQCVKNAKNYRNTSMKNAKNYQKSSAKNAKNL